MSLVIRLTQIGKKGERKFRVVVKEKRSRRDGKPVDTLGWYEKRTDKVISDINKERFEYWLQKGAKPSAQVAKLMSV